MICNACKVVCGRNGGLCFSLNFKPRYAWTKSRVKAELFKHAEEAHTMIRIEQSYHCPMGIHDSQPDAWPLV